ncbi:hypothetical protein [Risungbinella massiliensis]|uniref:hypothetical protein n=1 Tax=Risungbinella massiliensis TaxID=1329796 RepID=UPI0005CC057D|nr:hypothetical protein [Risungbinella massiliensis]
MFSFLKFGLFNLGEYPLFRSGAKPAIFGEISEFSKRYLKKYPVAYFKGMNDDQLVMIHQTEEARDLFQSEMENVSLFSPEFHEIVGRTIGIPKAAIPHFQLLAGHVRKYDAHSDLVKMYSNHMWLRWHEVVFTFSANDLAEVLLEVYELYQKTDKRLAKKPILIGHDVHKSVAWDDQVEMYFRNDHDQELSFQYELDLANIPDNIETLKQTIKAQLASIYPHLYN